MGLTSLESNSFSAIEKKFLVFYKTPRFIAVTFPCPEPDNSNPRPSIVFLSNSFNKILPSANISTKMFPSLMFYSRRCKPSCSAFRAISPANLHPRCDDRKHNCSGAHIMKLPFHTPLSFILLHPDCCPHCNPVTFQDLDQH